MTTDNLVNGAVALARARISRRALVAGGAALVLSTAAPASGAPARPAKPLVLGHRGAPAHRPEHTLASYAKAIADGADFVEPDLVVTKDGVLVARHENNIAETTDVANHPEFADRRVTKIVDGLAQSGWFTEDFTLAELKALRACERLGALRGESRSYDGQFQIVTFDEIADFVAAEAAARGRTIGLIPELKHGTYFASIGLALEPRFLAAMRAGEYLKRAPMIVQSFEVHNLQLLRRELAGWSNVQLMQLVDPAQRFPFDQASKRGGVTSVEMLTPAGLAQIATYADWVAPASRAIILQGTDGRLLPSSGLVAAAHRAGLLVGTWTFRPENRFLAADFRDGAGEAARNPAGSIAEIRRYLIEGIDAFFTDDPLLGREAVDGLS